MVQVTERDERFTHARTGEMGAIQGQDRALQLILRGRSRRPSVALSIRRSKGNEAEKAEVRTRSRTSADSRWSIQTHDGFPDRRGKSAGEIAYSWAGDSKSRKRRFATLMRSGTSFPETASRMQIDRFIDELFSKCGEIARLDGVGRKRDELIPGLSSLAHKNHVIFFRRTEGLVSIVRILNGARDIEKMFLD